MRQLVMKNWLLLILIVLALVVRLYRIHFPILDWHSWRQADTASVAREYVKHGIDPLRPKYLDLSNIPSGLENPEGWRMVEFPIHALISASILRVIPQLPLEIVTRSVSIFFSLGTLVSLYALCRLVFSNRVAFLASFWFAFLPYSVYYSRVVLPEPVLLFFSTFSLLGFARWVMTGSKRWYLLSLLALMAAFVTKPFAAFLAPVYLALAFNRWGFKLLTKPGLYLYAAASIAPFLAWRHWIAQFPAGIPASDWLFNSNGIRLRPAWFRWLGYERLTKLLLGFFGLILLPLSFLTTNRSDLRVLVAWWAGIASYLIVIATGNVHHDYYQALLIPILSISLALGTVNLDRLLKKKIRPHWSMVVILLLYAGTLFTSWQFVKGYFNINHWEYVRAGQAVDRLTPPDAKVIAPAMGDTAFLFQTNRTGWPIGTEIDKKIQQGATHYVNTAMDEESKTLAEQYFIVEQTNDYLILDLKRPKEQP